MEKDQERILSEQPLLVARVGGRYCLRLLDIPGSLKAGGCLARHPDSRGRLVLRELLAGDPEPRVRALAAAALGEAKDAESVAALARALEITGPEAEPEAAVRESAAWALTRIGTPEANLALGRMLVAEESGERRQAVVLALSVERPEEWAQVMRIRESMSSRMTVDFAGQPLNEICAFLSHVARATFIFDPAVDQSRKVTLKTDAALLSDVLAQLLGPAGLTCTIRDGAFYIAPPEAAGRLDTPAAVAPLAAVLRAGESPALRIKAAVELGRLRFLDETLDEEAQGVREIRRDLRRRVGLGLGQILLIDVLDSLRNLCKRNFVLAPEAARRSVTLETQDLTLEETLRQICRLTDCRYLICDGVVYIVPRAEFDAGTIPDPRRDPAEPADEAAPGVREVHQRLRVILDMDLGHIPLAEVVDFLQQAYKIAFVLAPDAAQRRVTCNVSEMSLGGVLRLLCWQTDCVYSIRDGAVHLRPREKSRAAPVPDPRRVGPLLEALAAEREPAVCDAIAAALKELTGQDLGPEAAKWGEWWKTARPVLAPPAGTAAPSPSPQPNRKER